MRMKKKYAEHCLKNKHINCSHTKILLLSTKKNKLILFDLSKLFQGMEFTTRETSSLPTTWTRLNLSRSKTGHRVHKISRAPFPHCALEQSPRPACYIKIPADVLEKESARATWWWRFVGDNYKCCHLVKLPPRPQFLSRHAVSRQEGSSPPTFYKRPAPSLHMRPSYRRVVVTDLPTGAYGGSRSSNLLDKKRHGPLSLTADRRPADGWLSLPVLLSHSWRSTGTQQSKPSQ